MRWPICATATCWLFGGWIGLGALQDEPEYQAAKAGDKQAALDLVDRLLTDDTVQRIKGQIGERKPLVLPVLAVEAAGNHERSNPMHTTNLRKVGGKAAAYRRTHAGNIVDWRFTTEDARIKLKTLYPCTGKDQAIKPVMQRLKHATLARACLL